MVKSNNRPRPERPERINARMPVHVNGVEGLTKNISATGVFFEIPKDHQVGDSIKFEIQLTTPSGDLRLNCDGQIVRVEDLDGGQSGVAVKILSQELAWDHPPDFISRNSQFLGISHVSESSHKNLSRMNF